MMSQPKPSEPGQERVPDRSPIPPMPVHLPVTGPDNVPGDPRPGRNSEEPWSPDLPPEPGHDPNP